VQTDETLCNAALAQTGSIRTDVTQNSSKRDHRRQFMPVLDSRNRRVRGLYTPERALFLIARNSPCERASPPKKR
jgi:hypothetical protein